MSPRVLWSTEVKEEGEGGGKKQQLFRELVCLHCYDWHSPLPLTPCSLTCGCGVSRMPVVGSIKMFLFSLPLSSLLLMLSSSSLSHFYPSSNIRPSWVSLDKSSKARLCLSIISPVPCCVQSLFWISHCAFAFRVMEQVLAVFVACIFSRQILYCLLNLFTLKALIIMWEPSFPQVYSSLSTNKLDILVWR